MNKLIIEALEHVMYELCRSDWDFMKRGVGFINDRIHDSCRRELFRNAFCKVVSLIAANTNRIFDVSVISRRWG
jgi:hypothetical protein